MQHIQVSQLVVAKDPTSTPTLSSCPNNVQLPQELIDSIVDILASGGCRRALRQCLLVSRAFYGRSRRKLFEKISMSELTPKSHTKPQDLLQILQNDPLRGIAPLSLLIRSLNLTLLPVYVGPFRHALSWTSQPDVLPRILAMLSNLNTFGLHFANGTDWILIDASIFKGFTRVFRSSSLTSLSLSFIYDFPVDLLEQPQNLRNLCLLEVSFIFPEVAQTTEDTSNATADIAWSMRSLRNLESLDSKYSDLLTEARNLSKEPFSRLKSLAFSDNDCNIVLGDLPYTMPSLESLTLTDLIGYKAATDDDEYYESPLKFHCLHRYTALQRVTLGFRFNPDRPPTGVLFELSGISEPITIRILELKFETRDSMTCRWEEQNSPDCKATWNAVDNLLTVAEAFPLLKKVVLSFNWPYREGGLGDAPLPRLRAYFEWVLPKLTGSQKIALEVEYTGQP